jgi:uncharacterized protein YceK
MQYRPRAFLAFLVVIFLSGCSAVANYDRASMDASVDRIEARIVQVCAQSGLFKIVSGVALYAIPGAALPIDLIQAGVDKVCANPSRYAHNAGTVAWLIRNIWRQ